MPLVLNRVPTVVRLTSIRARDRVYIATVERVRFSWRGLLQHVSCCTDANKERHQQMELQVSFDPNVQDGEAQVQLGELAQTRGRNLVPETAETTNISRSDLPAFVCHYLRDLAFESFGVRLYLKADDELGRIQDTFAPSFPEFPAEIYFHPNNHWAVLLESNGNASAVAYIWPVGMDSQQVPCEPILQRLCGARKARYSSEHKQATSIGRKQAT
jgi:hypothetical protein